MDSPQTPEYYSEDFGLSPPAPPARPLGRPRLVRRNAIQVRARLFEDFEDEGYDSS